MNEKISQCPKCMTSFRVTDEQLQIAAGKVRCGYCMNVFMGGDYLISGGTDSEAADEDVLRALLDPEHATELHDEGIFQDANTLSGGASSIDGIQAELAEKPIEPDVDLLDQHLKFDEDDLQESSDESWALALLAELEEDERPAGAVDESGDASESVDVNSAVEEVPPPASSAAPTQADSKPAERKAVVEDPVTKDPLTEEVISETAPLDDGGSSLPVEPRPDESTKESPTNSSDSLELTSEMEALESIAADMAADNSGPLTTTRPSTPDADPVGARDEAPEASLYEDASSVYAPMSPPSSESKASVKGRTPSEREASSEGKVSPKSEESPQSKAVPASKAAPKSKPAADSKAPQKPEQVEHASSEKSDQQQAGFLPYPIEFDDEQEELSAEAKPMQWRWIAATFGLVCLLGLQYVFFYWDDLVASSGSRPVLASVCKLAGCELPPFRDLNSIRVDRHVMQAHADVESARTLDVIIRNRAEFPQPFPVLQLTFSDMNNLPVATRRFFPNEYLDGELLGLSSMPSGSPVRLSLHVMEPGVEATNYELDLLPTL